ncbi:hypothetical protein CO656_20920 [Sinorhizobium sp. FG01]|nr:hypothetical protein CO656_20920 [Sinorhizobium sp. FG01]
MANAVAAAGIVLADAIGRRRIDRYSELLELLRLGDDALRADMPLELRGHKIRLLGDDAFEARIVVGEPFDLGIHLLVALDDRPDPNGGADHPILEAEQVKDFGAALADRDGPFGRLLKRDLTAAIGEHQRIAGFGGFRLHADSHKSGGCAQDAVFRFRKQDFHKPISRIR